MRDDVARPMRIAYFSPLPPTRSGIADYSAELLPHLAQAAQITLFVEAPDQVADDLRADFEVRPIADYARVHWQYDIALYQMGDSLCHEAMYPVLLRYGGVTVLHDFGLHHFIATRTIPRGDFAGYVREMGYALGTDGVELAYRIQRGEAEHPLYSVPLNDRLLDRSLGVIVHSRYVAEKVRVARPCLPLAVIPAPIHMPMAPVRSREALGCPADALLFVSAGQVIANKQLTLALEAFARLRADYPQARYVVVGDELKHDLDLPAWLAQRGLSDAVTLTGYLADKADFVAWIAAADVLVNLRYPTVGETSATALRGLAAGRPVIVSDLGWYAELPDDVCVKVRPNDLESLLMAMRHLAADPVRRQAIGQRAAAYARAEHTPAQAAKRYLAFITHLLRSTALPRDEDRHGRGVS